MAKGRLVGVKPVKVEHLLAVVLVQRQLGLVDFNLRCGRHGLCLAADALPVAGVLNASGPARLEVALAA